MSAIDTRTARGRESLIDTLKHWRLSTQFSAQEDWIFASPAHVGRMPWSYKQVWCAYQKAGAKSGIGKLGTHSLRHTYRSWLDAVGTSVAVQQKLMRHASITTTMNHYGDVVTNEETIASGKVSRLALNGTEAARKAS
jgi:integrase